MLTLHNLHAVRDYRQQVAHCYKHETTYFIPILLEFQTEK